MALSSSSAGSGGSSPPSSVKSSRFLSRQGGALWEKLKTAGVGVNKNFQVRLQLGTLNSEVFCFSKRGFKMAHTLLHLGCFCKHKTQQMEGKYRGELTLGEEEKKPGVG